MDRVALETLVKGALKERFEDALAEVIANIYDLNREAKAKRKLVLTLNFTPDADRYSVSVSVDVKPSLAPLKTIGTMLFIEDEHGTLAAYEQSKRETELVLPENVIQLKKGA